METLGIEDPSIKDPSIPDSMLEIADDTVDGAANPEKTAVKPYEVWFVTDNQPGFDVWAKKIFKNEFKTNNFTSISVERALEQTGAASPDLVYFGDRISPEDKSTILGRLKKHRLLSTPKKQI